MTAWTDGSALSGLAKNTAQLDTLLAFSNLWMVLRRLLQGVRLQTGKEAGRGPKMGCANTEAAVN